MKHLDFIVLDELCLLMSILLAIRWAENAGTPLVDSQPSELLLIAALINLFVIIAMNTMEHVLTRGYYKEFASTLRHTLYVTIFTVAALAVRAETEYFPRGYMTAGLGIYFVSTFAVRIAWKYFLRDHSRTKETQHNILIVTDTASAPGILDRMEEYSFERYRVMGLVLLDRDAKGERVNGVPVVANLSDAAEYLCREWTDEVFFFHASLDERCSDLLEKCREMALTIHLYIAIQGVDQYKQTVESIAGYEVLTANINMMSPWDTFLKRAMDFAGGLLGSAVAAVVLAVIGPKIKKASPGPLLFKQTRIGENGQPFKIFKIRSMYMDAEERKKEYAAQNDHADGMLFKMEFDPRVIGNEILPDGTRKTGIGDFIRRTSLDEFPQFFNVLRGEMSLVGTRPPTVDEWEKYEYHHRARMSVKPGMTGLWQINKRKDHMDFDEVVRLDTEYIATWSMGTDLRIIFMTMVTVARRLLKMEEL